MEKKSQEMERQLRRRVKRWRSRVEESRGGSRERGGQKERVLGTAKDERVAAKRGRSAGRWAGLNGRQRRGGCIVKSGGRGRGGRDHYHPSQRTVE